MLKDMKKREEEGDVKLELNKSSIRGNVLTLALTLGTLISVLFLFVGGIIGWLYKEHKQRHDISEMHPEMYDLKGCLLYTSPSPRDRTRSRMPSSA